MLLLVEAVVLLAESKSSQHGQHDNRSHQDVHVTKHGSFQKNPWASGPVNDLIWRVFVAPRREKLFDSSRSAYIPAAAQAGGEAANCSAVNGIGGLLFYSSLGFKTG